ncbi:hypothetical protein LPJ53_005414 [Coemansia erecta]|uniref:RTA1 like protein n=1 Tax=Coemansia erecta TaxID=147472 RepID=A0A9W8CQ98_9FUNG|nr:hypothetical protein LPJ53_005414 [Coemansia erecta]
MDVVDPTYYFSYTPVQVAPEVLAGVFVLISVVLCAQTVRAHGPRWLLLLSATAMGEAVGYGFRTLCIYQTTKLSFTLMTLFLLLPPNLLALTNYKTLGATIQQSPLMQTTDSPLILRRPRLITWSFAMSDAVSFLLQAAGVAISTQDGKRELAKHTVLVGLVVQLVFFAGFLALAVGVVRSWRLGIVRRGPRDRSDRSARLRLFTVIIATTGLLYVRSAYRVAEFVGGYGSWVYRTEWMFYVCDAAMVLASFVVYMTNFIGHHL